MRGLRGWTRWGQGAGERARCRQCGLGQESRIRRGLACRCRQSSFHQHPSIYITVISPTSRNSLLISPAKCQGQVLYWEVGLAYPVYRPLAESCPYFLFSSVSRSKMLLLISKIASISLIILSPVLSPPISSRKNPVLRHVSNSWPAYVTSPEDNFERENLGTSAVGTFSGKGGSPSKNLWDTMMMKGSSDRLVGLSRLTRERARESGEMRL